MHTRGSLCSHLSRNPQGAAWQKNESKTSLTKPGGLPLTYTVGSFWAIWRGWHQPGRMPLRPDGQSRHSIRESILFHFLPGRGVRGTSQSPQALHGCFLSVIHGWGGTLSDLMPIKMGGSSALSPEGAVFPSCTSGWTILSKVFSCFVAPGHMVTILLQRHVAKTLWIGVMEGGGAFRGPFLGLAQQLWALPLPESCALFVLVFLFFSILCSFSHLSSSLNFQLMLPFLFSLSLAPAF